MASPSVKFLIWFDTIKCTQKTIYVTLCTRNDKVDLKSTEHTNILQKSREIFVCLLAFHFVFINMCNRIVISCIVSYFKFHTKSNHMSGLSEKYRLEY